MKKKLLGVLIIIVSFFISSVAAKTTFAYFVGGTITSIEAPEITTYEAAGYDCDLQGGMTMQVYSANGLFSYFIPGHVAPVTKHTPAEGQSMLGITEGYTTIVCTRDEEDGGNMTTSQVVVILETISLFGTSAV